ncbi:hypothetical protein [Saccharolobus shibatae]|uniref:Uncharacterized protein n=1 Tax=Saccharolobus shibatae TaxID=2286 RepID=A0A8F5C0W4_9CREN|nr:hypothetical protein [Saccharolobus shibatae]QXJ34926.1 hypothetical protein J5U22_01473 [Saccharolobus shibatae]
MNCDLACDEEKVIYKAKEILNGLRQLFGYFDNSLVKEIKVESPIIISYSSIIRGNYDYDSKTVTVNCINGIICVETLIHEIIHSNGKYIYIKDRRTRMYIEGLTEFFTLYYLKKKLSYCLDHRFTDEICKINKDYEVYTTFWGNLALVVGINNLWDYYVRGEPNIDDLIKNDVFITFSKMEKMYKIKVKDLVDVITELQ